MEVYKSCMFHRGVDSYWLLVDLYQHSKKGRYK
ncbi:hypothetical protein AI2945V1_4661 [Klebsiella oxytoca]|nr:hypothetical protein AI2945V1_4661 [Klebsiella oxytoca]CAH5739537.1 hypothetical protein AI2945V1_4661 [Klebsiella oxytoca]